MQRRAVGEHELILIDNNTNCADTVNVTVTCNECDLYAGPTDITVEDCNENAAICLAIPFADRADYMVRVNGVLIGLNEDCAEGSQLALPTGLHIISITNPVDNCGDEFEIAVSCPDDPVVTPTADTIDIAILIGFTDTLCLATEQLVGSIATIENTCDDQSGLSVDFNILADEGCIEVTADAIGQDTACIVFCDELGVCDTTTYLVRVMTPQADTVRIDLEIGQDSVYCFDDGELRGNVTEIENICSEAAGEAVDFTLEGDQGCVEMIGVNDGTGRGCFVFCDDNGLCDTTYILVNVGAAIGNDQPTANNDTTSVLINTQVDIEVT